MDKIYFRFKNRFTRTNVVNLNGIDMVYVISMPQRIDYITKQMHTLGINYTLFNAITPSILTTDDYNNLSTINIPKSPIYHKYTRLAVLLSFTMCFMDAIEKGYDTIIIFEDDIKINVKLELLKESIIEFKNSNLDIFYMGYCFLNCGQFITKHKTLIELSNPNLLCCQSMCIKTYILPGLIKYCFPMKNNSDQLFRDYYIRNKIKVCVPRTVYFTQNRETLDSLNESLEDKELFKTCKFLKYQLT